MLKGRIEAQSLDQLCVVLGSCFSLVIGELRSNMSGFRFADVLCLAIAQ